MMRASAGYRGAGKCRRGHRRHTMRTNEYKQSNLDDGAGHGDVPKPGRARPIIVDRGRAGEATVGVRTTESFMLYSLMAFDEHRGKLSAKSPHIEAQPGAGAPPGLPRICDHTSRQCRERGQHGFKNSKCEPRTCSTPPCPSSGFSGRAAQ